MEVFIEIANGEKGRGAVREVRQQHQVDSQDVIQRAMNRTKKGSMISLAFLVRESRAEFVHLRVHPRVVLSHRHAILARNHSCLPPRAPNYKVCNPLKGANLATSAAFAQPHIYVIMAG